MSNKQIEGGKQPPWQAPGVDPRLLPAPLTPALLAEVGGKAASLTVLRDAGFAVPEFVIWPVGRLNRFLAHHTIPAGGTGDPAEAARRREQVLTAPWPDDLVADITAVWERFAPGPLCVRSSGTCEDLAGLSFAGQYESVLDLRSAEALLAAVRQCWASLFHPRVCEYFRGHAVPFAAAGMAVVIQRYLPADHAGVAFTVNPLNGDQRQLLLEYCAGAGDKLVGGLVTPARVVADPAAGRVLEGTLPPAMPADALRRFREVQAWFGAPQDIEWVLADGRLWLVQSRPITRIHHATPGGPWTTADFRDGGVSSGVVTPLMGSLYDYIWNWSMPRYFQIIRLLQPGQEQARWGDNFYGRPYWNLGEVIKCLLHIPGFIEKNLFDDLGITPAPGYRFRSVPFTPRTVGGIVPTALSLERYYGRRLAMNKRFRRDFPRLIADFRDPAACAPHDRARFGARFGELIRRVYFRTETSYFLTIYNTSNAKLEFKVRLDALNARGHDFSYIKLITGLLNVKHLDTLKELSGMARTIAADPALRERILRTPSARLDAVLAADPAGGRLLQRFRRFIEHYGYHSSRELDLAVPRWEDDTATVWRLLKTFLRDPDPEAAVAHEKRQRDLYRAENRRVRAAFAGLLDRWWPVERWLFFRALRCTRSYCWWREEMRDHSSRVYALIRRWAVEAGRRLGLADGDIFWLTWQQIEQALLGQLNPAAVTAQIATAREEAALWRHFRNPDELGIDQVAPTVAPTGAGELLGVGCSPGLAEGTVRVVGSLDEIDRIRRGDILVTRFTDPGWTPIFHLLGGVVTETGGILSHAAVISREYGIPAVLNVAGATSRLRDGERVRLDGCAGAVHRVLEVAG